MTLSVGVIYGVFGFLILCETNAQYNGFESYYNQDEYYKQYPQYTQAQANAYHGYTTPQAINSNPNSVQVIEVSIPDLPNGKQDGSLLKGVINQLLSQTGSAIPYTFSVHTYSDKKTPYINPQRLYGSQSSSAANSHFQSQTTNIKQVGYYQQQQYEHNLKQQQYEKELEQYEQKLREYYANYPSSVPQQATTSLPIIKVTESVKPNEIKPITQAPIVNNGKTLTESPLANQGEHNTQTGQSLGDLQSNKNNKPSDGKSFLELINEGSEQTGDGKSLAELLGHQSSPSTEAPKKSLDDLIGNIFTEKEHKPTEATPNAGGKSLFELLAELPPEAKDSKDIIDTVTKSPTIAPSKSTESNVDESTQQGKKNSDVAGGDYGLDVRADDNKTKRVKRNILRRMADNIANFRNHNNRHENRHECGHNDDNERRNHHSHHNHGYDYDEPDDYDGFVEQYGNNEWHDEKRPKHHNSNSYFEGQNINGYEHEHHSRPNHNNDHETDKDSYSDQNQKPRPFKEEKPLNTEGHHGESLVPSQKPISDIATQTDLFDKTRSEPTKDPTLDIDIRGGFEETRTKRHNLKRIRRSPEEDEAIVFQDEDETKPKVEDEKVTAEADETDKVETADKASDSESTNPTEANGEDKEKGELDSRFGFFGGGGGFHRQVPGRNPIGSLVGGVVGGIFGGLNGLNQGYDPYNRQPGPQYPQYPQYPNQGHGNGHGHGHHQPDYYPPPQPQQPPVHIHINNIANAQSQATNTALDPYGIGGSNQNAAANAQNQNYQNEYGAFQNTGASGQASNLGHDGSGQLSAANAMNQNYQNEFGSGSKNNAQSQAANFDPYGNLALTSSNSGTNHFAGPDGVRDETNSAAQSSLQGQFGAQNSGAQSNTYQGPNGSGSSASSQASSINNGFGSQNSGSNAAANSGNIGGNSFGNAQSQTYANDQWGW